MHLDDDALAWARLQELVNAGVTVSLTRPAKDRGPVTVQLAMGSTVMVEREAGSAALALRRAYETWWPRRDWRG